ncbi:hypothetical protein PYCCODRAFT_1371045 [Trametes coccinea BRFM310]|uniref:AB hydrolase-1 domain-containing protein n=1 Tax=Trametes coccinea (strain BRFM310) TaxID=1353009 RepID=A0A1Y2IJK9_TRAC3|nr:hypothetical protein PYCCODRAFT_1371045 [Trametes coccinea BRFM310]
MTSLAGGLHVLADSGAPEGLDHYPTVVIVHGYVWHGGIFAKLLPLAQPRGARVILLNRKDYPGAAPYTDEERTLLPPAVEQLPTKESEIRSGTEKLEMFMEQRAQELYECLQALVVERRIPPACRTSQDCGIVLVGWSLGACWMTALLSHIARLPVGNVLLSDYIRRVVLYDALACLLGYPYPAQDPYNPFRDSTLTYEERGQVFTKWITSYFSHGETAERFERREALSTPLPTLASMSNEDFASTVHVPPGLPGGSDWTLLHDCLTYGTFTGLRERALFLPAGFISEDVADNTARVDTCADVEIRSVWGDHSVWEVPYAVMMLRQEVNEANKHGKVTRPVSMLCVKGANHFAQWDYPERVLDAFLTDNVDFRS